MHNGQIHSKCPICGFVKKSYGAVLAHINKEHLHRMIQCVYCDKVSYSKDSIQSHQRNCPKRPQLSKVEVFEEEEDDETDPRSHVKPHEPENLMQEIEKQQKEMDEFAETTKRLEDNTDDDNMKNLTVVFDFEK